MFIKLHLMNTAVKHNKICVLPTKYVFCVSKFINKQSSEIRLPTRESLKWKNKLLNERKQQKLDNSFNAKQEETRDTNQFLRT